MSSADRASPVDDQVEAQDGRSGAPNALRILMVLPGFVLAWMIAVMNGLIVFEFGC